MDPRTYTSKSERFQAVVMLTVAVLLAAGAYVALLAWMWSSTLAGIESALWGTLLYLLTLVMTCAGFLVLIMFFTMSTTDDHVNTAILLRSFLLRGLRARSVTEMNERLVGSAREHEPPVIAAQHMDEHKARIVREAKSVGQDSSMGKIGWFDSPRALATHLLGRLDDFYMSRGAGLILDVHHFYRYQSGTEEAAMWAVAKGYARDEGVRTTIADAVSPIAAGRRAIMAAAAENISDPPVQSQGEAPMRRSWGIKNFLKVALEITHEAVGLGNERERIDGVVRFLSETNRVRNLSEEVVLREAVKTPGFCDARSRATFANVSKVFDGCDGVIVARVGTNRGRGRIETFLIAPPVERHVDESGRLHNESGPAIVYMDGWSLYFIHGVRVPESLVNDKWDVEAVLSEPNAEVRRVAIEMMGWEHFIEDGGFALVDADDDPGNPGNKVELYDLPVAFPDFGESRVLICTNGTVERDGTRRKFGLVVPADRKTAIEAAAWTYGLSKGEYMKAQRRS